ncbi:MAG: glycosyltransferase family 4 protein [Clostridium sp.]|nr:glycosyltransferase family 4 protein [Clostridium sp.]
MKKYIFAGDWTIGKMAGAHRVAYEILCALDDYLSENPRKITIQLLIPENSKWKHDFSNISVIRKCKISSKAEKIFWQQWVFPAYVKKNKGIGIDLALALPLWGCDICAIYDCILETYPEGYTDHKLFRKFYMLRAKRTAKIKSRKIITDSETAKKEIQKYYKVSDDRITVIGAGWEHMKKIKADKRVFDSLPQIKDKEYFFALGSKYKHKNFRWILKIAKKNPQYQFVISGEDSYSDEIKTLGANKPDNVFYTGYITDGQIKALMAECKAFIQPSLYEGFGIPPLEALSVGAKIIVSNASCLPEIYKDTAYYIDPFKYDYDLDILLKEQVTEPKKVLDMYTWENAAKTLLERML